MTQRPWRVEHVDSTGSTQDLVLARSGEPEGLVVWTQDQRAGRGRHERAWVSPAGAGVAISLLVRPTMPQARWTWLPLLLGRAAARAVRERGVAASVKWPNDIVVEDGEGLRKLGGVIAQVHDGGVVLGVGLNVAMVAAQRPDDRATSLALEGAVDLDAPSLVTEVVREFDALLAACEAGSDQPADYIAECVTIGSDVRVLMNDGTTVIGRAIGVDQDGALVIERSGGDADDTAAPTEEGTGRRVHVTAGDVTHLR